MRIVIDSNIWISVFINNDSQSFIKKILDREIEIISSSRQVEEVSNVLSRPKIKNVIAHELIEEFLILFFKSVDIVETKIKIKVCRDEKDNFILETAISGSVDYIVTEDKDLLVLNPYETVKIVTAKEFYKII
ncbi:MAG: putative toxin-antitoxin system toxin component, PIN family [Bacteroidetes bacterium]|nr:putative toxin-antitoxin system toxin component, PIN family [Bacteroidota bacterium]